MVNFGFYCVQRLLIALNILFTILSITLISVAAYAKSTSIVSTNIISGLIFCGAFLFTISLIGFIGTLKHHQVFLFFYMVTLFLCFIIQFVIAIVCLAVISTDSRSSLLKAGWHELTNETIRDTQFKYDCCGFDNISTDDPTCPKTADKTCFHIIRQSVIYALNTAGGVALAFCFTNLLGIWLAVRYRNLRDPKYNPTLFM